MLLDEGKYLASVSTIYRLLRFEDYLHHRSNSRVRTGKNQPPEKCATGVNQVWAWDITWMPQIVKGLFYYAYVILDIYDKYIVGWAVHAEESDEHSADLFEKTLKGRNIKIQHLHSDNGNPMKGITLRALLDELKVTCRIIAHESVTTIRTLNHCSKL